MREKGTFKVSTNVEPKLKAPYDSRTKIDLYEELFLSSSWQDDDGNIWLYRGLKVDVTEDTNEKNGTYILLDPDNYDVESSWHKLYGFYDIGYYPPFDYNIEVKDIPVNQQTAIQIGDTDQNRSMKLVYQISRGNNIRLGELFIINVDDTVVIYDGSYRENANVGVIMSANISSKAINLLLDVDNSSPYLVDIIYNIQRMLKVTWPLPGTHQYTSYNEGVYTTYEGDGVKETFTEGSSQIRKRIEGNYLYKDRTLTGTGFFGTENVDWEWFERTQLSAGALRNGVRNGVWYIDTTLTTLGFSGIENTDWQWVDKQAGTNSYPIWRDGIRGGKYVIDHALDAVGFSGTKEVNWENIL